MLRQTAVMVDVDDAQVSEITTKAPRHGVDNASRRRTAAARRQGNSRNASGWERIRLRACCSS